MGAIYLLIVPLPGAVLIALTLTFPKVLFIGGGLFTEAIFYSVSCLGVCLIILDGGGNGIGSGAFSIDFSSIYSGFSSGGYPSIIHYFKLVS